MKEEVLKNLFVLIASEIIVFGGTLVMMGDIYD